MSTPTVHVETTALPAEAVLSDKPRDINAERNKKAVERATDPLAERRPPVIVSQVPVEQQERKTQNPDEADGKQPEVVVERKTTTTVTKQ
jgi:hypothetical protein